MAIIKKDEDGLIDEPCLSCKNLYFEDIWYDPMCDVDNCPYNRAKTETKNGTIEENN